MLTTLRRAGRRALSTKAAVSDFSQALARRQPTFPVPANNIRILAEPREFYTSILDIIGRAQRRIFLSSLYIGSSETELLQALQNALERKPGLEVTIQLDLNRSTRPGKSSARLLLPLLQAYPGRVHVNLFRSPHLNGIMAKLVPPRFNEGWGTWHAKIYGADDDIIIGGANLSKVYFTNRRDRYIHLQQNSRLADYCLDFLKTVSTFSFRLLPSNDAQPSSQYSYPQEDYLVDWPDSQTHPHQIHTKVESAFKTFQASHLSATPSESNDVHLHPLIQGGQFNVREEEETLHSLFDYLKTDETRPLLDLTSGYFNLYKPYQKLVLDAKNINTRIVAASPLANGFYGSRGISNRIPEGYTILERRFMKEVRRRGSSVELNEWEQEGWTYHAKGLWLTPNGSQDPVLTLFGSTNLNARSADIDTELSFMMVVPPGKEAEEKDSDANMVLRRRLAEEVASIRAHAREWRGEERTVRPLTPFMLALVKDKL
ncbi:phospholipase D/nuclease [Cylindrobasidium torrendii FP15055 ss-10]|uniref:CDP-diacylglycerol--glycerol-3-phosphate 3-phosphatidyltransferase n=1 Tax=Cylindrobasidium torrendii FP15055 ss-10 TaxID=1314674 RepID=A0A0D7BL61_9AGAR|nr:phospholipase D/nuclease [Cylindrobasidium torrendii FP15055 ss-10]